MIKKCKSVKVLSNYGKMSTPEQQLNVHTSMKLFHDLLLAFIDTRNSKNQHQHLNKI